MRVETPAKLTACSRCLGPRVSRRLAKVGLSALLLAALLATYMKTMQGWMVPPSWPASATGARAYPLGQPDAGPKWLRRLRQQPQCSPTSSSSSPDCVPFLCTSVEFETSNYTERMLASIHHPVAYTLVITAGDDVHTRQQAQRLQRQFPHVHFVHVDERIGVSGGWNLCMHFLAEVLDVDWGYITNNDVYFPGRSLHNTTAAFLEARRREPRLCVGRALFRNIPYKNRYSTLAVTRTLPAAWGTFDENIFPSYYEDNDVHLRSELLIDSGCRMEDIQNAERFHHGPEHADDYVSGVRDTVDVAGERDAATRASIKAVMERGIRSSARYLQKKWGCRAANLWGPCRHHRPFGRSGMTPRDWVFDAAYRRCLLTGEGAISDTCHFHHALLPRD
ncbi:hypothetical protein CDCA_CDCA15G3943 [Cyanidium caldarium]|uniref:Uncharacterized protein n=1 Tax=Cyanidium caldarium TaxID=2771 RepID=A0AAV9J1K9_CYACA|nr:hypothetical protein CDCA_CDCA15G3943 [Cyanidium caldarium]